MRMQRPVSWVIGAVALHSLALGTSLLVSPRATLGLVGWTYEGGRFFPAQCGVFLVILGLGYVAAVRHRSYAWGLVVSKVVAVVFLVGEALWGGAPPILLVAAALDAAMAVAVGWLLLREGAASVDDPPESFNAPG